jgi:hypothetical protein
MPRLKPLNTETVSPEIKAAFNSHIQNHQSRITNMKATMGRSILAFEIYMRWYDLYEAVKAIVGNRAAYLFSHAISQGSNCPLCTTYFRKIIIENGEDPRQLVLTDKEQKLLDFGAAIANNNGQMTDEIYNAVARQYSETDLVVLVAFAGQMIATNVFSNVFEVAIDDYLVPYVSVNE